LELDFTDSVSELPSKMPANRGIALVAVTLRGDRAVIEGGTCLGVLGGVLRETLIITWSQLFPVAPVAGGYASAVVACFVQFLVIAGMIGDREVQLKDDYDW